LPYHRFFSGVYHKRYPVLYHTIRQKQVAPQNAFLT
jgi:hypothetical protein